MDLKDLHNPNEVTEIFHLKKQHWITPGENQGWQEYPKSVELWQFDGGRLMRVKRWLKKSIIVCTVNDKAPA